MSDVQPMLVTVGDFLSHAQTLMPLTLCQGEEELGNVIPEEAINRPGLALAEFYQYFANKRIQVFGLAEMTYLKSIPTPLERERRLERLFQEEIPCVVLTRNRTPPPELERMARKFRVPILRTPLITSRFVNLATLAMEHLATPALRMSGTTLDVMGIGVLIEGAAGIGKSEAALGLIERGFSLVADDVTLVRRDARAQLMCTSTEMTRYHMEIRGLGIIHVPSLFGMASVTLEHRLDMVVSLYPSDPLLEGDRSGLSKKSRKILDVTVPLVELPVAPGRDMAGVIEVAAMNQKLAHLGHEAAKEFDQQVIRTLQRLKTRKGGGAR
ncbi:MAG: HPr(Ser) kinase/phosphatase [Verrucomicrobia bacterium]|nr:HPr(Ser) kinase/phosphatase [Verrucomicrobiota bacterium]MCH8527938.1 HPr(Ser) kinase/phosphatase [Kiritimatiellia bacterium]